MVAALVVGLGAGEPVHAVVLGVAAMAPDPMPFDPVRRGRVDQLLPQLGVLDRLPVRRLPAVRAPFVDPARDPVAENCAKSNTETTRSATNVMAMMVGRKAPTRGNCTFA